MPYEYLEDKAIADIAFEARGNDLEEMFRSAAEAVMNVMIEELDSIESEQARAFETANEDVDMLLFDFMEELIYYKDSEQLLLKVQDLQIEERDGKHYLEAVFKGEVLDPQKHEQRVDVKAVTMHEYTVEKRNGQWYAHVILDI